MSFSSTCFLMFALFFNFPSYTYSQPQRNGTLAGETCTSLTECARGSCDSANSFSCIEGSFDCTCSSFSCETKSDCLLGETCETVNNQKFCLSKQNRRKERPGNLTLAQCEKLTDCATGRDCFYVDEAQPDLLAKCIPGEESCRCIPLVVTQCNSLGSTAECNDGEICSLLGDNLSICMDPRVVVVINTDTNSTRDENTSDVTNSPTRGLTLDLCRTDEQCQNPRTCLSPKNGSNEPCTTETNFCACTPPSFSPCSKQSDCSVKGEVCGAVGDSKLCLSEGIAEQIGDTTPPGFSELLTNSAQLQTNTTGDEKADTESTGKENSTISLPDNEEPAVGDVSNAENGVVNTNSINEQNEGVCIAVKALSHLPQERLINEQHVTARVLCDRFGSCATPGHIVYFNGTAMMMRTYCQKVTEACKEQIELVNSPKWSRRLRITSASPGLHYTAFAARYATATEERFLRAAVRFGL